MFAMLKTTAWAETHGETVSSMTIGDRVGDAGNLELDVA
jgi:hypothetical protein